MQLYTSLVRLKQAMNGGQLPPMMSIPENVRHFIDPDFTIGLGALTEDATKGLRCPVRGCGVWKHNLSAHVTRMHPTIGTDGLRRALSIPPTAPLFSQSLHDRYRAVQEGRVVASPLRGQRSAAAVRKGARCTARSAATIGARNLRDRCDAQLKHHLIDLQNKIGRSPSIEDAISEKGRPFVNAVLACFGTWNSAKAQCGMEAIVRRRSYDRTRLDGVLTALQAYYEAHRCLPSPIQGRDPTRIPLIPSRPVVMRELAEPTWQDCMAKACRLLGIRDGRYGVHQFPEPKAKEQAALAAARDEVRHAREGVDTVAEMLFASMPDYR